MYSFKKLNKALEKINSMRTTLLKTKDRENNLNLTSKSKDRENTLKEARENNTLHIKK